MALDLLIAELAARQHGVVSVSEVRALGGTRRHLERRAARGALVQLNHQAFRVAGVPPTWEAKVLAAVLAAGPAAAASHFTAAALWGLGGFGRGGPELSIPRGQKFRPDDARCHESTDLDRCLIVLRDGIPTTDVGRTILDLGRYVGVARLSRVAEQARREQGLTWAQLIETLFVHARQGRHGVRRLRQVIATNAHRDEVTDSDFEHLVLALFAERGVPQPVLHHEVRTAGRLVAELDLAWPLIKLAVELDGQHHRERETWEADHIKLVELEALGWTVLPFTWRSYVRDPDWLVRTVLDAHRRRQPTFLRPETTGDDT